MTCVMLTGQPASQAAPESLRARTTPAAGAPATSAPPKSGTLPSTAWVASTMRFQVPDGRPARRSPGLILRIVSRDITR